VKRKREERETIVYKGAKKVIKDGNGNRRRWRSQRWKITRCSIQKEK
jgi:hypothetical protein